MRVGVPKRHKVLKYILKSTRYVSYQCYSQIILGSLPFGYMLGLHFLPTCVWMELSE